MALLQDPLPGGHLERTDQGVDISSTPGAPIVAAAPSRLVGVIQNWFDGEPFEWFKITAGPLKGKFWYVAEQINPVTEKPGTNFAEGQTVAHYAQSGTAIETGFATASGQTLARATTGYTEGEATPAGAAFRKAIGAGPPGATVSSRVRTTSGKGSTVPRSIIVTASEYGPTGPNDNTGSSGQNLNQNGGDSFAELSTNYSAPLPELNFDALGGLPYGTPVTVTNLANGKSVTVYKRDVGAGGPGLQGHKRAIDLWHTAAAKIGFSGLGLVRLTFNGSASAAGMARPGGGTSGSGGGGGGGGGGGTTAPPSFSADYTSLVTQERTAPQTAFTSFDIGKATSALGISNLFFGPASWLFGEIEGKAGSVQHDLDSGVKDVTQFLDIVSFIANPKTWLRAVEFLTGIGLMFYAMNLMSKSSPTRGGSASVAAAAALFGEGKIARDVRRGRQTREYETTRHTARMTENERRLTRAGAPSSTKPRGTTKTAKKKPGPASGKRGPAKRSPNGGGAKRVARKVAKAVK